MFFDEISKKRIQIKAFAEIRASESFPCAAPYEQTKGSIFTLLLRNKQLILRINMQKAMTRARRKKSALFHSQHCPDETGRVKILPLSAGSFA